MGTRRRRVRRARRRDRARLKHGYGAGPRHKRRGGRTGRSRFSKEVKPSREREAPHAEEDAAQTKET